MDIELIEEAKAAVALHGSQAKAAKALNIARSTLQNRLQNAARTGNDGLAFKAVPFGHSVKGVSTYYDKDGVPKAQWLKTRVDTVPIEDLVEYFKDAFASYEGAAFPASQPSFTDSSLLSVYPIADFHLGMMSWGEETGADWDMKIAEETIMNTMSSLVMQSPSSETALIANLGDWFHINDSKNMTPASGNILDVDSRYQKIVYTGVRIMVKLIDMALTKHKRVIVRNVRGNHDPDSTVALNVALKLFYSANPNVSIEDSPKQFWYYRFGTNLLGFFHGHTCKAEAAAMNMACENPEDWGKSKFRMMMHGHIHHTIVKEVGNVFVESFNTIAARDEYAASHAYFSNRKLTAITFHETKGPRGRHYAYV